MRSAISVKSLSTDSVKATALLDSIETDKLAYLAVQIVKLAKMPTIVRYVKFHSLTSEEIASVIVLVDMYLMVKTNVINALNQIVINVKEILSTVQDVLSQQFYTIINASTHVLTDHSEMSLLVNHVKLVANFVTPKLA